METQGSIWIALTVQRFWDLKISSASFFCLVMKRRMSSYMYEVRNYVKASLKHGIQSILLVSKRKISYFKLKLKKLQSHHCA